MEVRSIDVLAVQGPGTAAVVPVNTGGVMGRGLALVSRARWPDQAASYRAACRAGDLVPGGLHVTPGPPDGPAWIVWAATKGRWQEPSRLEWIRDIGLGLARWAAAERPAVLAVPALGVGCGGLPWGRVRGVLAAALEGTPGAVLSPPRPPRRR